MTATKEKGVIFRPWEVQATLAGRKGQFRRPVKPQPETVDNGVFFPSFKNWEYGMALNGQSIKTVKGWEDSGFVKAPYAVGQRLWVKEVITVSQEDPDLMAYAIDQKLIQLGDLNYPSILETRKTVPAHQMHRTASRITLEVTEVRCEKVQDISEEDAIAEGVELHPYAEHEPNGVPVYEKYGRHKDICAAFTARESFQTAYEAHHGAGSFERDWVWVVGFKVLEVRG